MAFTYNRVKNAKKKYLKEDQRGDEKGDFITVISPMVFPTTRHV